MPFAVLILHAGQTNVSIRLRPPAFHPNVHPGLCYFLTPGDRPLSFHASGRSMAQPPARRRICTERPITNVQARLLGLLRQSSRAARAIVPVAVRYCLGLCLSQVCGHQPVCLLRLDAKHAVSPGTKLHTPRALRSFSASGSLRSRASAAIRSLRCAATSCRRICISDAAGSSASFGADAWPIPPVSSPAGPAPCWRFGTV